MQTNGWWRGLAGLVVLLQMTVWGADRTWLAAADGNFTNGSNWSGGVVPGNGNSDTPYFNVPGTYTVAFTSDWTNNNLKLEQGYVTLALNGHTYTITNPPAAYPNWGSTAGSGCGLTITGGTVTIPTGYGIVYVGAGQICTLKVVGAGAVLNTTNLSSGLVIRQYGDMYVTDGGVSTGRALTVAGRATVANGGILSAMITIGDTAWGNGELWVTNGGHVSAVAAGGNSYFWVGNGNDGGKLVVSDPGSIVEAPVTYPEVGQNSSNAIVIVTNGGLLRITGGYLVGYSTSTTKTGVVVVAGNGARLEAAGGIALGYSSKSGVGKLRIGAGGVAAVRSITAYSNSVVSVAAGGTLSMTGTVSSSLQLNQTAILQGDGQILGQGDPSTLAYYLRSSGTISPGLPTGTLFVSNLVDQLDYNSDAGRVLIELGGTNEGAYDRLSFMKGDYTSAKLTFGGTCEVVCINGFVPRYGDVFNILDWTDLAATPKAFAAVVLPDISPYYWVTNNLYMTGEISVFGPPPASGILIQVR